MNEIFASLKLLQNDIEPSNFGMETTIVDYQYDSSDALTVLTPLTSCQKAYEDFSMEIQLDDSYQFDTPTPSVENKRSAKNSTSKATCFVCNDKSAGKHYNVECCDGCKGFFRRTVRQKLIYTCQSNENCPIIDKVTRRQCKFCRLKKCYMVGMKAETVQEERDKLRPKEQKPLVHSVEDFLTPLLNADAICNDKTFGVDLFLEKLATLGDIHESMKNQLRKIDQWSKNISGFSQLSSNDHDTLLKAHAKDLLLLEVARRSLDLQDMLLLDNNSVIYRSIDVNMNVSADDNLEPYVNLKLVTEKVMDELVRPFTEVDLDAKEFAAMKAIVFFDPNVTGLVNKDRVKFLRSRISTYLEDYVQDPQNNRKGRINTLLLTIPCIQSIANQMVGQLLCVKVLSTLQLDDLIEKLLLTDIDYLVK